MERCAVCNCVMVNYKLAIDLSSNNCYLCDQKCCYDCLKLVRLPNESCAYLCKKCRP